MYTKKLLAFLFANYLPIFIWILLFNKGSLIILFLIPFNVLIMTFDYLLSYGIKELWTAFLHLIAANVLGAVLQGIILMIYPLEHRYSILTMFVHILFFTLFIFISMFILKKPVQHRKKQKDELYAKKKEAYEKYIEEHGEDENEENDDEDDEYLSRRRNRYENIDDNMDEDMDDLSDDEYSEDPGLYGDYRPASRKEQK